MITFVMLVNAWNNAPDKLISTAALNREQPKMFASVIQLEVVENLWHMYTGTNTASLPFRNTLTTVLTFEYEIFG